jgi:Ca2+-binding EF-hand superfamily protein
MMNDDDYYAQQDYGLPPCHPDRVVDWDIEALTSMSPEEAADKLIDQFDKNGDQGLERNEIFWLINHIHHQAGIKEMPREVFNLKFDELDLMDGFQDGTVSRDDLVTIMDDIQHFASKLNADGSGFYAQPENFNIVHLN